MPQAHLIYDIADTIYPGDKINFPYIESTQLKFYQLLHRPGWLRCHLDRLLVKVITYVEWMTQIRWKILVFFSLLAIL